MHTPSISRVILYKHGVGYFERACTVTGDANLSITFKQREVSDVLKSLTVLDLDGGRIASVSYDSTKPLEKLLAEVAISIPDEQSLVTLLPQLKGARIAVHSGVSDPTEGAVVGIDTTTRQTADGIVSVVLLSILTDAGDVRSFDLHNLASVELRDPAIRRDLEFYLKTQLSSKKKESRTFTFFAEGEGERRIGLSYLLEAPVWKATYRILLSGEDEKKPMIQGWAVVDNTQDEDWEDVQLSLVAGLPVSFTHDLYTPRYIRRPEVAVQETTGVLPPTMEDALASGTFGLDQALHEMESEQQDEGGKKRLQRVRAGKGLVSASVAEKTRGFGGIAPAAPMAAAPSSMPAQVRERKIGDLFEYAIEHPVTIQRNQSALVPIVLREFKGKSALLYNKANRAGNPLRCVELNNTTGLTLEGGPVTVLEKGTYVGEAMLDTLKPDENRLIPFAVELSVFVLDNVESHQDRVTRVVAQHGTLMAHYEDVQKTTYHFNNKSDQRHELWLEEPRFSAEWKLAENHKPEQTTENFWRFRVELPAKSTTAFVVEKRLPLFVSYRLDSTTDQQLKLWIQQRFLDAESARKLGEVLQTRQEIGQYEASIQELEKERSDIHQEQGRIRENMQALGERVSEKELRERFVRTLTSQEDRLEVIRTEMKSLSGKRDGARQRLTQAVAGIKHQATL